MNTNTKTTAFSIFMFALMQTNGASANTSFYQTNNPTIYSSNTAHNQNLLSISETHNTVTQPKYYTESFYNTETSFDNFTESQAYYPNDSFNSYSEQYQTYQPVTYQNQSSGDWQNAYDTHEFGTNNYSNYNGYNNYYPSGGYSSYGSNDRFDSIIEAAAARHGVDPSLIKAIIHTESDFNPYARSHAGAQGLMQLMPATADRFGVYNVYDPEANINAGTKYIAWLINRYAHNLSFALAGYNAGEGNVDKYNGIPPFSETQNYVRKVLDRYYNLYQNDTSIWYNN